MMPFMLMAYCILHKMCQMRNLRIGCINAQYMRKIVVLSPMRNICTRFAQDCTFSAMRNICARFAQDVVVSPMRNICTRFAQDCTYLSNAQYMRKIVLIINKKNMKGWDYSQPRKHEYLQTGSTARK